MRSFNNNTNNKNRTTLPATYISRSPAATGIRELSCIATFKFTVPRATGPRWEVCEFVFDVYQSERCHIVTRRRIVIFISAVVETRNHVFMPCKCEHCCPTSVHTACFHDASVCWQRRNKLHPPVSLRFWSPKCIISLYLVYCIYRLICSVRRHCRRRAKRCKLSLYRNKS